MKTKPKAEVMLAISKAHAAISIAKSISQSAISSEKRERLRAALDEADKALMNADAALAARRREIIAAAEAM